MVAEVIPPAIAWMLWTICMSMAVVVVPGFVCEPPSSAARRAPWRTAEPEVTLSEIMTLASKPPISSMASSGVRIASSTSDCPRRCRTGSPRKRRVARISVALRLQPDVVGGRAPHRTERRQEASLPGIGEVDGRAEEVGGPIANVARFGWPRLGDHRGTVKPVPVEENGVGCQVPVRILVELVDVDLGHREDAGRSDAVADHRDQLVIGRCGVADLGGQLGALDGGVASGSHAEHDEAAVQHPEHEHEQHGHDNDELGHGLAQAVCPSPPPPYGKHYAPYKLER